MNDAPPKAPPPPPQRPRGIPPPLPPQARRPPPVPAPIQGEKASEAIKSHVVESALGLLEEQVQARIVHYKADLDTNPELDAITAQVVAQLKEMQAGARSSTPSPDGDQRDQIRASHERTMSGLLVRVFPAEAPSLLVEKKLKEIHRKLARLFFQSELHEKTRNNDGAAKVIQHGEQAIFYVLMRYQHRLMTELGGFDYASDEIKERTFDLLAKIAKDNQDAFLSRRSSELKRIVSAFHSVLVDFFCKQLAGAVPEFSREVIAQAGTFEGKAFAYKIAAETFPRFRAAFERRLMTRLVGFAEDHLLEKLADTAGAAREETVAFVTDPRVFSMIAGEVCDAIYEFLCNEGFLDLPLDWRQAAAQERTSIV